MTLVLLFKVTNLVVKMFQVILETLNLVVCRPDSVFNTEYVFFALYNKVFLMFDSTLSWVYFSLEPTDLMLWGFIGIVFRWASLPQFTRFFALLKAHLLSVTNLFVYKVKISSITLISQSCQLQNEVKQSELRNEGDRRDLDFVHKQIRDA
jgi:hypothetical protein